MAASIMVGWAGIAAADTLVVRSSGPSARSYPPGKAIPESQKIVLKANDQVVILDGRGTRTLKGPGSFSPTVASNQATDSRTTFAALVSQRSERRARIGAVRSVKPASDPRNPNLWFVDVERSSNTCVIDPAAITMWRAETGANAALTVTNVATGKAESVNWKTGESTLAWPASMPVTAGAEYRLSWPGAQQPTLLKFAVLGPDLKGLESMAAALIKHGCEAQLDLLIETVAIPDKSGPTG